jgi:hypothetical protein
MVVWRAPERVSEVIAVLFREESFLPRATGAVGGLFLADTSGGAGEPLEGEAGLEPSGGAEDETFLGETCGTSAVLLETGGTTKGSDRPV